MNHIRNSAKAVIIRDGCLLLVRNRDGGGDWFCLPGGGQNHGETLQEALQRECQEEIGVRVQAGDLRLIREYIGKDHEFAQHDGEAHQVEFMFECRIAPSDAPITGKTPDTQQAGIAWVPLSKLPDCNLYPKVLRQILKNGFSEMRTLYLGNVN
jgi:ADP-ribose pyrophosphatase YjhB (NUDIX family)